MPQNKKDLLRLNKEYDQFEDTIVGNTTEDFYALSKKLQMAFLWSVNKRKVGKY